MSRRYFPRPLRPLGTAAILVASALATISIGATAWSDGAEPWLLRWTSPDLYRSLARRGFVQVDIDGDGIDEVVTTTDGWTILRYVGGFEGYRFDYVSKRYTDGVAALGVLTGNGEEPQRIVVAIGSGQLLVYRATDQALLAQVPLPITNVRRILAADADNDGADDLVLLGLGATALLDPDTYALRRTLARGGEHLAIGNVDDDEAVELVYGNGFVIEQDGDEESVDWDSGFQLRNVLLADVDGDGDSEIIRSASFPTLTAHDVETESVLWEAGNLAVDGGPVRLTDVTDDGTPEIVVSTGSRFFAVTLGGTEVWTWFYGNPDVNDFAIFDADGNGDLEVVGAGDQGATVWDLAVRNTEWSRGLGTSPYVAVDTGDVDGDGDLELVAASNSISTYDAETLALESDTNIEPYHGTPISRIGGMTVGDQDGDGSDEILVAGSSSNVGALFVLDAREQIVRHLWLFGESAELGLVAFADVDADGAPEIVAVDNGGSFGSSRFLFVIDPADGSVEWKSDPFENDDREPATALEIANVDDDAAGEIVVAVGRIHVIDGVTHRQWTSASQEYSSLALPLRRKLGRSAIVAGTFGGRLAWIDGVSRRERLFETGCDREVPGLLPDRVRRQFFTCGGRLAYFHRPSRSTAWKTPFNADSDLGLLDSLVLWRSASGRRIAAGGDYLLNVFEEPAFDVEPSATENVSAASRGISQAPDPPLEPGGP